MALRGTTGNGERAGRRITSARHREGDEGSRAPEAAPSSHNTTSQQKTRHSYAHGRRLDLRVTNPLSPFVYSPEQVTRGFVSAKIPFGFRRQTQAWSAKTP